MKKTQEIGATKGNPTTKPPTGGSAGQPPPPAIFPTLDLRSEWRAAATPPTTAVENPEEAAFLKELEEKFGSREEAQRLFARFSAVQQGRTAETATIEPQPSTISDVSTAQPSIPHSERAQTLVLPHAEIGLNSDMVEQETGSRGTEEENVSGFADEIDRMAVEDFVVGVAREGNTSALPYVEGETPSVYVEGGTPFESKGKPPIVSEGVIPNKPEEETPIKSTGETPISSDDGESPNNSGGDEVPVKLAEEQRPKGSGSLQVVNVDEIPEDSPVDLRASRRMVRRSLLDEVEEDNQMTGSGFLAPGAMSIQEVETPESEEEVDAEEERRLAKERKRKGKKSVIPRARKSQRLISAGVPPRPTPKASEPDDVSSETEEEEEAPNFERQEVWLTKKLITSMAKFDDAKRAQTHKDRSAAGKLAKSGKQYDPTSLQHIESEEEFLGHIRAIGFEWLLKHSEQEVPVDAAREFFSTFRFKATTDPDADSISFRLFNSEHTMSVREWSLRMGLFTNDEDEEGVWNDREFGPPKNTPGFTPQTAWESITHARSGIFKTSVSKGIHITDHLLRFAQEFIGYNLMGTASSTLTTTELYFTWCMSRRIKVHLGYWLAQACHQMTTNPSRHMYTCHLLGAYIERNYVLRFGKAEPDVMMCDPPELFSLEYFFNKGLLYMEGEDVCFYTVGANVEKVRRDPELMEGVTNTDMDELRKEMAVMREELGGAKLEIQALRTSVDIWAERAGHQNERMAEAVKLMQKMAIWLGEMFPHSKEKRQLGQGSSSQQQRTPGPGSVTAPPGQGSMPLQRPPPASKPMVAHSASTKKPLSRPLVVNEEEAPASPAKKKVKVKRPNIPSKSGSQGSRTQN